MAIAFVPGNIVRTNQVYIENTLALQPSSTRLSQTLEMLGDLGEGTATVLAAGNLNADVPLSYITLLSVDPKKQYHNLGKGFTIYFLSDDALNNSFLIASKASYDVLTGGQTNTLYVDANSPWPSSLQVGSLLRPFKTISQAISAIPAPLTIADTTREWVVYISPADYDEDLIINKALRLTLIGMGPWRLGDYSSTIAGVAAVSVPAGVFVLYSKTVRNIVWTLNNADSPTGSAAPQLNIMGMAASTLKNATPAIGRISGSIHLKGDFARQIQTWYSSLQVDAGGVFTLSGISGTFSAGDALTQGSTTGHVTSVNGSNITVIQQSEHRGKFTTGALTNATSGATATIDTITSGNGVTNNFGISINCNELTAAQVVDYHSLCRLKSVQGPQTTSGFPQYIVGFAVATKYDGLFSPTNAVQLIDCAFNADITMARATGLATLGANRPAGIRDSYFANSSNATTGNATTVNGPTGVLALDGVSNYWFTRSGCIMATGTKVLTDDTTQTLSVSAVTSLAAGQDGVTVLANPTSGSFAVNLPTATGQDNLTFTIKNVGTANNVSLTPSGSQTIDGVAGVLALTPSASATFSAPSGVKIVAQGGNWFIVSKY